MKKVFPLVVLFFLSLASSACLQDPLSVSGGGEMQVKLRVTGGLADADYLVLLDGEERSLVGVSCVNLCSFSDGEVLQSLTSDQVEYVWSLFQEADIHALNGEDFGVLCCDQFHFDLDYRDSGGRSRVMGSSEALPQELRSALSTVMGMVSGTIPVIVSFETTPASWPGDPLQIQTAAISGHDLKMELSYGGGCRLHDVKVVAWGGWMESDPVQIKLFLSHEDFDDPCDAWITREFTFDLVPLKVAYEGSYGVGEPDKTTLVLLLEDPMLASPLSARWLEYRF